MLPPTPLLVVNTWTGPLNMLSNLTKWGNERVKLTHKLLSSETCILNKANNSLEVFALHAAPVLRLFWKVIQITFSQVSVLQLQGTCSCYSHYNCPDIAQKTFQSVDRVNPGVLLDFYFGFWICFIIIEVQNLKYVFLLMKLIDSLVLG